jgi:hypothetical protein
MSRAIPRGFAGGGVEPGGGCRGRGGRRGRAGAGGRCRACGGASIAGGGAVPRPLCFRQTRVFRIGASGRSKCPLGGRKPGLFGVARSGDKFRRFHDGWGGYFSFVPVERDAVGQWELPPTSSPTNRRLMFRWLRRKAARRRTRPSLAHLGGGPLFGAMPQRNRRCEAT